MPTPDAAAERLQQIKQRFDAVCIRVAPIEPGKTCECPLCDGDGYVDTNIRDTIAEVASEGFGYVGIQAFGIGQRMLATTEFVHHLADDMAWLLERAAIAPTSPAPPAAEGSEGAKGPLLPDAPGLWFNKDEPAAKPFVASEVEGSGLHCNLTFCDGWRLKVGSPKEGNWHRVPAHDAELRAEVEEPPPGLDYIDLSQFWHKQCKRLATRLAQAEAAAGAMREDAERWRKLMACGRIRFIGGANLGTPHAHLGIELWARWEGIRDSGIGRRELTAFVDALQSPPALANAAAATGGSGA